MSSITLSPAPAVTLEHWVIGETIDQLPRIFEEEVTLSVMKRTLTFHS